jgi:hypothetical protein
VLDPKLYCLTNPPKYIELHPRRLNYNFLSILLNILTYFKSPSWPFDLEVFSFLAADKKNRIFYLGIFP